MPLTDTNVCCRDVCLPQCADVSSHAQSNPERGCSLQPGTHQSGRWVRSLSFVSSSVVPACRCFVSVCMKEKKTGSFSFGLYAVQDLCFCAKDEKNLLILPRGNGDCHIEQHQMHTNLQPGILHLVVFVVSPQFHSYCQCHKDCNRQSVQQICCQL